MEIFSVMLAWLEIDGCEMPLEYWVKSFYAFFLPDLKIFHQQSVNFNCPSFRALSLRDVWWRKNHSTRGCSQVLQVSSISKSYMIVLFKYPYVKELCHPVLIDSALAKQVKSLFWCKRRDEECFSVFFHLGGWTTIKGCEFSFVQSNPSGTMWP